jgi:hypothetical protein
VFAAVAIPVVVFSYTGSGGADVALIVIGVIVGLVAGVLAGLWVSRRGGDVWRGPQL